MQLLNRTVVGEDHRVRICKPGGSVITERLYRHVKQGFKKKNKKKKESTTLGLSAVLFCEVCDVPF